MKKKVLIPALGLLVVDIITKLLIDNSFNLMETKPIILNFFAITKVYNDGASWNLLAGYRYILIIISIVMLIILWNYQKKFVINTKNIMAFSLLFSGITGNLFDRIIYGHVIDFLDFTIFGYNYPVFNFADVFIVLGVILIVVAIYKKEDNNEVSSG